MPLFSLEISSTDLDMSTFRAYLSEKKRSIIPFLPFSWLKKINKLQCISHVRCCNWLSGDEKFCYHPSSNIAMSHVLQCPHNKFTHPNGTHPSMSPCHHIQILHNIQFRMSNLWVNDLFKPVQLFNCHIPILHQHLSRKLAPQCTETAITVGAQSAVLIKIVWCTRVVATLKLEFGIVIQCLYLLGANLHYCMVYISWVNILHQIEHSFHGIEVLRIFH